MEPLKFEPIYFETLWGGEEWILSPIPGKETMCNGQPLSFYVKELQHRLLGTKVVKQYGNRFPILIKNIKSRQQLSVQVHPNDTIARSKGMHNGKTEMWLVNKCAGDASENRVDKGYHDDADEILVGLSKKISAQHLRTVVYNSVENPNIQKAEESLESLLQRYKAKKGDCFFIPAGTIHSIGAGLDILEIQQASETTYRLYDFNRIDKDGKRRRLDIEDALNCIAPEGEINQGNYSADIINCYANSSAVVTLASCPYFTSIFVDFSRFCRPKCGAENFYHIDNSRYGSFSVIVCIEGSGKLLYNNLSEEYINKGDVLLLPAELGSTDIYSTSNLQLVEVHI